MEHEKEKRKLLTKKGMYDSSREHDACGVGFLININGEKTNKIIRSGVDVFKEFSAPGRHWCR